MKNLFKIGFGAVLGRFVVLVACFCFEKGAGALGGLDLC